MTASQTSVSLLRNCWSGRDAVAEQIDYKLLADLGGSFAARSRSGFAALVIPLPRLEGTLIGRRGSGIELLGHASAQFAQGSRIWDGSAAALLCTDPDLIDAFAVLAADIAARSVASGVTWTAIIDLVEEWQALLAPKGKPSTERETGLWGELWFIQSGANVNKLIGGWRGPERDLADFFVDGVAAEVKTARIRRHHHVSRAQVDAPAGAHPAWLLSLWVKVDPAGTMTVPVLVDSILARASDCSDTLRRIVRAGYSPANRSVYERSFVVLDEPEWYAADAVPRVRVVDPGVSQLRYRVTLDETRRADAVSVARLWTHFHGSPYGS